MLGHPSIRDYDNIISKILNNIIIKHFLPFTNYFFIFNNNNNINIQIFDVVNNGFLLFGVISYCLTLNHHI